MNTKIKTLNIESNEIEKLDDDLFYPINVDTLNLSGNKIRNIHNKEKFSKIDSVQLEKSEMMEVKKFFVISLIACSITAVLNMEIKCSFQTKHYYVSTTEMSMST